MTGHSGRLLERRLHVDQLVEAHPAQRTCWRTLSWSGDLTGRPAVGDGRLQRDGVPQPGGVPIGDDVRVEHGRVRGGKVRPVGADQYPGVRISDGRQQCAELESVAEYESLSPSP